VDSGSSGAATRYLSALFRVGTVAGLGDRVLLERFADRRGADDEAAEIAFAALVERHGPMVLRVCRAVLGDRHEAEDAFQATFLVLASRARSIRRGDSVGSWLHGVALRVANRARWRAARRRHHERRHAEMTAATGADPTSGGRPPDDVDGVLHEEIGRLPEKYRRPVVLCYLEGLTHDQAADRLGWPVGTVRRRLAGARDRLRGRLTRRGVAPAVLPAGLAGSGPVWEPGPAAISVPPRLAEVTVRGALRVGSGRAALAGIVSAEAIALMKGVTQTMRTTKLIAMTAAILAAGLVTTGVGLLAYSGQPRDARAASAQAKDQPPGGHEEPGPAEPRREFELSVVGPDGKPIPGAEVELGADPLPTAEQIRKGKLIRQQLHWVVMATNAAGQLVLELPRTTKRFNVYITIPGYGPFWAGWSSEEHDEPIPPRFTAELEAAWSAGGIVVDPDGKPVAGAEVSPSIEFKKRPGEVQQLGSGARVMTDAAGQWRFDSVPVSMADVHVSIVHPSLMPLRRQLARREFGIEPGREPAARIVLDRGLTVTGKVTDESGKPIAGALVRTKFWNDVRQARTGPDGVYRLIGCEPRPVRIVASAEGRAMDMKELNIEPGMGPVDFRMKPGGTVRVRVVDERGNPVPRTRIFFQRWRGMSQYFEFAHVNQYADEKGAWVWHEAPLDEFRADICPPGGMQLQEQPLIAREAEYVFRVTGPLVVSGKVIDAVTKEPIKTFRVVPGRRWDQERLSWNREDSFVAADGHYEVRQSRGEFAHLIRIEAEGYRAAVSRDIRSNEGTIAIDFELKPGKDIVAKVVTPSNLAAVGAKVALGSVGAQIHVANGDISENGTFCPRAATDDSGRFHFPAQDEGFTLVITHPTGFANIHSTPEWTARIIRLEPWSRVEGTFRVGEAPAANVPIEINVLRLNSFGQGGPSIFSQHTATTGPDGRFVFERVLPGTGRIGRQITFMVREGATEVTSSHNIGANFPSGKTVHIDLGGTGRPVVGRLQPAEGFTGKARWNFAVIRVEPGFMASVDRDGRFRIDDVPPGDYSLTVQFDRDNAGHLRNHRFRVPPPEGDPAVRPVDLGTLKLEKN
jgi:RNA polymerase sigma factor (sigma-70 family)